MRKKILEKKLARLNAKKQSLSTRCQASSDVNEVRELTNQLEDVNAEIEETQAEIDAINAEEAERSAQAEAEVREVPAQAQLVNGNVMALYEHLFQGNSLTFDCLDGRVGFNFTRSGKVEYVANFTRKVSPTSEM